MMIKILISGLVFWGFGFGAAIAQEKSAITFAINQAGGLVVEGEIPEFSATACFDENNLEGTKASLSFNMASATTGIIERDLIMQAPEWLNTEAFPEGHFVLESLTATAATGTLTLKGADKEISFPVAISPNEEVATGDLTIDRRDFNIGEGRWGETEKWVGFEIRISFRIVAGPNGESCGK